MSKKTLTLIIVTSLLLSNNAYSYYDKDMYKSNNYNKMDTSYNYNNDYLNDFSLSMNARDDFFQNSIYSTMIDMWQKNDNYTETVNSRVAPNINVSDYAGYEVTNNTKWQSYSSTSDTYETQLYTDVKTCHPELDSGSQKSQFQSFNMLTLNGDYTTKDTINNLAYNDTNNIMAFSVTNNGYKQDISNIKYQDSNQIQAYESLKALCTRKLSQRERTFNFNKIFNVLENQKIPASSFPSSFDLKMTSPKGNTLDLNFSNITWNKNNITSFDSKITTPDGLMKEMRVETVLKRDTIKSLDVSLDNKLFSWNNDGVSLETFKQQLGDASIALDILGSKKVQLGDNKVVFLDQHLPMQKEDTTLQEKSEVTNNKGSGIFGAIKNVFNGIKDKVVEAGKAVYNFIKTLIVGERIDFFEACVRQGLIDVKDLPNTNDQFKTTQTLNNTSANTNNLTTTSQSSVNTKTDDQEILSNIITQATNGKKLTEQDIKLIEKMIVNKIESMGDNTPNKGDFNFERVKGKKIFDQTISKMPLFMNDEDERSKLLDNISILDNRTKSPITLEITTIESKMEMKGKYSDLESVHKQGFVYLKGESLEIFGKGRVLGVDADGSAEVKTLTPAIIGRVNSRVRAKIEFKNNSVQMDIFGGLEGSLGGVIDKKGVAKIGLHGNIQNPIINTDISLYIKGQSLSLKTSTVDNRGYKITNIQTYKPNKDGVKKTEKKRIYSNNNEKTLKILYDMITGNKKGLKLAEEQGIVNTIKNQVGLKNEEVIKGIKEFVHKLPEGMKEFKRVNPILINKLHIDLYRQNQNNSIKYKNIGILKTILGRNKREENRNHDYI